MLPAIKLSDVFKIMEQLSPTGDPVPFTIVAISASRRDPASAGRIIVFKDAILAKHLRLLDKSIPLTQVREYTPKLQKKVPSKPLRNSIRKLYLLQDKEFRNVHVRLIMSFNGRPIHP